MRFFLVCVTVILLALHLTMAQKYRKLKCGKKPSLSANSISQASSKPYSTSNGQYQASSEPSSVTSGDYQASSEPSSVTSGEYQASSEPSSVTSGDYQASSEPSSVTSGEYQASSEPSSVTSGEYQANSEPSSATSGGYQANSELSSVTSGEYQANSEPSSATSGKNQANSELSSVTSGQYHGSSEQSSVTSGEYQASTEPSSVTSGKNQASSGLSSVTSGQYHGSSEQSSVTSGEYQASTQPSSVTSGQYEASSKPYSTSSGEYQTSSEPSSVSSGEYQTSSRPYSTSSGGYQASTEPSSVTSGQYQASSEPSSVTSGQHLAVSEPSTNVFNGLDQTTSESSTNGYNGIQVSSEPSTNSYNGKDQTSSELPTNVYNGNLGLNNENTDSMNGGNTISQGSNGNGYANHGSITKEENQGNINDACTCVEYYQCDKNNTIIEDGEGIIDMRMVEEECEDHQVLCCPADVTTDVTPTEKPVVTKSCGQLGSISSGISDRIKGGDEAGYGEFPWMVAVIRLNPGVSRGGESIADSYQCGGSLIHQRVVLTAAHCVRGKNNLTIRAGEWDIYSNKNERFPTQDIRVRQVIVHEKFYGGSLANDPALLILEEAVDTRPEHVGLVCLPEQAELMDGRPCLASGWGKQDYGKYGKNEAILKRVELPVVAREPCLKELRKTRLSEHFKLHESLICAGGVPGQDTCSGDGGSPLVCPSRDDPDVFVQAGIVAWGINCGTETPGVYVNVPHFVDWIHTKLQQQGISLA